MFRSLKTLSECKQALGILIMATVQDQEKSTIEDLTTVTWNKEAVTVTMALVILRVQQRPRDARAFLAIADLDVPLFKGCRRDTEQASRETTKHLGPIVQKNTGRVCAWKPPYLQA